jgi:hypothetical protein
MTLPTGDPRPLRPPGNRHALPNRCPVHQPAPALPPAARTLGNHRAVGGAIRHTAPTPPYQTLQLRTAELRRGTRSDTGGSGNI